MLDRTGVLRMQSPRRLTSLLFAASVVVTAVASSCGGDQFSSPSAAHDAGASGGSSSEAGADASTSHGGAAGAPSEAGAGGATSQGGSSGGAGTGGSPGTGGSCAVGTCYRDADGDGFGNPSQPDTSGCTTCVPGFVSDKTDCNDDPTFGMHYHPGQTECFANDPGGGWDFNCNGVTDPAKEGCEGCGQPSVNARWCDGACGKQVFKLITNYVACGGPGRITKVGQTCGDQENCGGTYPLQNDVGAGDCLQKCR